MEAEDRLRLRQDRDEQNHGEQIGGSQPAAAAPAPREPGRSPSQRSACSYIRLFHPNPSLASLPLARFRRQLQ